MYPMHLYSPYICVGLFNTFGQYADYTHPWGACAGGLWYFLCVCLPCVSVCLSIAEVAASYAQSVSLTDIS